MYNLSTSEFVASLCSKMKNNNRIDSKLYDKYSVKRGLRNSDGTGVMAGITRIGNVIGYSIIDGEKTPLEGKLYYRGYEINDLINGFTSAGRFGFEEITYLLLFGELPSQSQYEDFRTVIGKHMTLPTNFTEDMIIKAPSADIMNKLARSVLVLYSYDDSADSTDEADMLHQAIRLISRFPTIIAHSYAVKRHYFDNESLYLHRPDESLSLAENFLRGVRPDKQYSEEEAKLLDLCMVIHAEHGGGNNSAFTCRTLASAGTDTYSCISAACGSLKGPKHGGANNRVMRMFEELKAAVENPRSDDQVCDYLEKQLRGEVGDKSGLIYGMGHAVYTLSDPRAVILKNNARSLAEKTGFGEELELMERIERLTPQVFKNVTGGDKVLCANVDMYSGLVYKMLGIPTELFTPLFAAARVSGWCAHRIEEEMTGGRIYRPAYKAVTLSRPYVDMSER
ncbi:MAG: citrate/2-methylcitrate synthase [Ruminococcaceae bacterium]|nr:citrate/2-methylcitrate synthase [Oscillospiraceae bacterium]